MSAHSSQASAPSEGGGNTDTEVRIALSDGTVTSEDLPPALTKKERPILFSAPMVRALLAGTKTQTRRACKTPPTWEHTKPLIGSNAGTWHISKSKYSRVGFSGYAERVPQELRDELIALSPYGQAGDRLWVRESWQDFCPIWNGGWCGCGSKEMIQQTHRPAYKATPDERGSPAKWRPSIHMPRWASRITLEVTEVRVQRLQGISEEDALAEGIDRFDSQLVSATLAGETRTRVPAYRRLWESINGPGSWDANPWVWAVSFSRVADSRT